MNFASRMQSNCQANQIQMAEVTAKILMASTKYRLTKRGIVHVKGKGMNNDCFKTQVILLQWFYKTQYNTVDFIKEIE